MTRWLPLPPPNIGVSAVGPERPRSAMLHEMTRTATAGRAKLVRVESYDGALDLTRGDELFGSASVIRFSCARPGAGSHAELRADKVHEIILNGRSLDPEQVCVNETTTRSATARAPRCSGSSSPIWAGTSFSPASGLTSSS